LNEFIEKRKVQGIKVYDKEKNGKMLYAFLELRKWEKVEKRQGMKGMEEKRKQIKWIGSERQGKRNLTDQDYSRILEIKNQRRREFC
jgi:hypothetical protein